MISCFAALLATKPFSRLTSGERILSTQQTLSAVSACETTSSDSTLLSGSSPVLKKLPSAGSEPVAETRHD